MSDLLHPRIGTVWTAPMRPRQRVPRRRTEALGPENRGRVKDEVSLGPGIDRRGPPLGHVAALPSGAFSDDFQARDVGWRTVVLPTNQPRNAVALLYV